MTEADRLHDHYHFLHWDFAFPEVFFDEKGAPLPDGGFDAVVGNPPYVRQQSISQYKPYLKQYFEIFHNNADLYLYFYERGFTLLKHKHRVGYVTSGTYMNSSSSKNFRRYIHNNYGFDKVINFGENQPFKGAEMVFPTIAILKKAPAKGKFSSLFVDDVRNRNELHRIVTEPMIETASDVTGLDEWRFQSVELTQLFTKISIDKTELYNYVDEKIFYGILTGYNDAFYINSKIRNQLQVEHESSKEVIKPLMRGQDLRPWYKKDNNDTYIIVARQGIEIERFPAIKNHLLQHRGRLSVKPNNWNDKRDGKWAGRTSGSYTWYEWHDTVAYLEEFSQTQNLRT